MPTPAKVARIPLMHHVPQTGVTHTAPKIPRIEVTAPPIALSQAIFLFLFIFFSNV